MMLEANRIGYGKLKLNLKTIDSLLEQPAITDIDFDKQRGTAYNAIQPESLLLEESTVMATST